MVFDPFISLFIRLGFGLIFAMAALHKLRDFQAFKGILTGYDIVPARLMSMVAFFLPLLEITIVILLLWQPLIGIFAGAGLLSIYALIMAFNIARGHTQIDCGCFWGSESASFPSLTWWQVFRNICLIAVLAITLLPQNGRSLTMIDGLNLALSLGFGFIAAKAGLTLMSVYHRMREVGHV